MCSLTGILSSSIYLKSEQFSSTHTLGMSTWKISKVFLQKTKVDEYVGYYFNLIFKAEKVNTSLKNLIPQIN